MKKWTYLAVAGMLLGSAPVFTGCVDTDEPWGVEQLRGAKAELLKAKAAVEQARVAVIEADAAYRQAEAAYKQAEADKAAAEAQIKQAKADLETAKTEAEKQKIQADLEQYLENVQIAREQAQKNHEIMMQNLESDLLKAQRNYELLQQEIEIAKAICSDQDRVTISDLQYVVDQAYQKLYGTDGLKQKLFEATQNLYNAQLIDKQGYGVIVGIDGKPQQGRLDNWEPTLQVKLEQAKADQSAAEQLLSDLKTYSDKEVEGTDWKAEVDKIIAEIDALEAKVEAKNVELAEAQSSQSYVEAEQAVNGVWKECDSSTAGAIQKPDGKWYQLVKPGTAYVLSENQGKLLDEQKKGNFAYEKSDVTTEVTNEMIAAINVSGTYPTGGFTYPAQDKISWVDATDPSIVKPTTVEDYPTALQDIVDLYDSWIKLVDEAIVDPNDEADAAAHMEIAKNNEAAAQKAYDAAVEKWETVLNIVSKQSAVQVPQTGFQTSATAYNQAYTSLKSAVDAWNAAYDKAYKDAADEKEAELTLDLNVDAITGANIPAVAGFDKVAALTQWNGLAPQNKTMAQFENAVNMNCQAISGGDNLATVQAKAWAQINNYVNKITGDINWSGHNDIKQAAEDAVKNNAFDKDNKLQAALTKAVAGMDAAVFDNVAGGTVTNSVVNAIAKFTADAKDYVQAVDTKTLNKDVLIAIADKDGKFPTINRGSYYAADATVKVGTKYTLSVNDITADEITAATKTTFDKTADTDAILLAVSDQAFGMGEIRYIEPERADLEDANGDIPAGNTSAAAKLYRAQDAVKGLQDQIDAADDLKTLKDELTADKAAFVKSVEEQYTKNFGELETAVATAQAEYDKTNEALEAEKAKFSDLTIEIAKLEAQVVAKKSLEETLKEAAWNNLGIEWPDDSNPQNPDYSKPSTYDPESFADDLAEAVKEQELVVADAKQKVAIAEANLQKAQDTGYDGVAYFQMLADIAASDYDRANEAYQTALNNLNKALEIMSGSTSDEQPAE